MREEVTVEALPVLERPATHGTEERLDVRVRSDVLAEVGFARKLLSAQVAAKVAHVAGVVHQAPVGVHCAVVGRAIVAQVASKRLWQDSPICF